TNQFTIQPLDPVFVYATRGAHASSWVRLEQGRPMIVALRTQRLDGGPGRNEYEGIVKTTASVAIASKTDDPLEKTSQLAVVPYGDGLLTLHQDAPASYAAITEHCFGGSSSVTHQEINGSSISIKLRQTGDNGLPVEWTEVQIS